MISGSKTAARLPFSLRSRPQRYEDSRGPNSWSRKTTQRTSVLPNLFSRAPATELTIVDNGEAALDALEHASFDLALFDLSMPVVSGLEALKAVSICYTRSDSSLDSLRERNDGSHCRMPACGRCGICSQTNPCGHVASVQSSGILPHTSRELCATTLFHEGDERPALTVVDTPAVDPSVLEDLGDCRLIQHLSSGSYADSARTPNGWLAKSLSARGTSI